MFRYKMRFVIASALISLLLALSIVPAKTWHLEKGQDWKAVSDKGEDKYLSAVAEIKKLVDTGKCQAVRESFEQLKKDFPEIAGPDLEAFIKAELLFCEGEFTKAVRSYGKFLDEFPGSELYEAALGRQFAIGTAFLAGQKIPVLGVFKMRGYSHGKKIMERISDRAGEVPIGKKAALAIAKSHEKRGKFNEAYHQWSQVSSRWPTGRMGKDALLAMGRCKHAAYKGERYDSSNLISAKSYYEDFKLRYSKDAEKFEIDKRLELINEQIAYKRFSTGEYYQKTGSEQPANLYYQMVVDNWPNSTAAKMARAAISDKKPGGKEEKKWQESVIEKLEELFL